MRVALVATAQVGDIQSPCVNILFQIGHLAALVSQISKMLERAPGVERVFSAAGKMHDDLRKSAKDST